VDISALFKSVSSYFPDYWLGTLVSAAFGAFIAAWVNNRIQTKKLVVEELNGIRASLILCFSIRNRYVSLKRQFVRPMHEQYIRAKEEHDRARQKAAAGGAQVVYNFRPDYRSLTPVIVPVQVLERYVFEKIRVRGRAIAAMVDLGGAIDGHDKAIRQQNELISYIHSRSPWEPAELAELYFGFRNAHGVTDDRFKDNLHAIYDQTNDCIFFSRILSKDLVDYGNRLRRKYAWKYRLGVPKFKDANWTAAIQAGLIPSDDLYVNWLRGFPIPPTKWQRFVAFIKCKPRTS
jgi:hypothetical protein